MNSGNPYGIPPDNPFVGIPGALAEIWALGLRNPWRYSFDRQTHDLWIADVGQNLYEEIDFQPANSPGGTNYGWRCYEGDSAYNLTGCHSSGYYTFPVFAYSHSTSNGCSIIGGFRYRGTRFPNFIGLYFFADYCSGAMWTLRDSSGNWVPTLQDHFTGYNFTTFGEDIKGELYTATLSSGTIYKIIDKTAGIAENKATGRIQIYPNPFTGNLTLELTSYDMPDAELSIFNLQGRLIYQSVLNVDKLTLNPGITSPGLYIVRLKTRNGVKYEKIIRE